SIAAVIDIIRKSSAVHQNILELSKEKSEYIKTGDMDGLSKLLIKERKHVQELTQIENEREKIVDQAFESMNINDKEKTVTIILNHIDDEREKESLERDVTGLLETIIQLRESEKLNEDLIQQSMQFVQLSLDMLQPTERNINYHKNDQKKSQTN